MSERRPIRVLFCLDNFDIGGTELNAVRTAERLDRSRIALSAACFQQDGPLRSRYEAAGIPLTFFSIPNLYSPRAFREGVRFARFVARERFDIVHAHDVYTNIFCVPWARAARAPAVIASRRWWTAVNRPELRVANRLVYRFAHRVLANSPSIAGMLERDESVPSSKLLVIPNFVDDEAFTPPPREWCETTAREWGIDGSAPTIGIVANFHSIKDHRSLLRALSLLVPRYPGIRLVLVGDGLERSALEALAASLGIAERVVFAGRRPHHPSPHWLFDVSVLCSLGEGFPNSIVEAMAAGRAVVATRVGGIVDAVRDGENGLLVAPESPEQLAAALDRLLSDRALRERMGRAGADRARSQYHGSAVVRMVESAYETLSRAASS